MEKLTKEQIENASQISYDLGALSSEVKWDEASDFIKNIWRLRMVAAAPFLQCAPTEPGAPLSQEDKAEILRRTFTTMTESMAMMFDVVDSILARRTVRKEEPAKLDGDVIERAAKAGNAACGLQTDDVDSVNRLFTAAAARVIVQDRDAKWEKATAAYLLDEHGWNVGDALFAASKIRARIEAKPKTPEERVTIRERVTDFAVDVDGIMDEYFRPITKAKACRLGLIAQRKQEEKERP